MKGRPVATLDGLEYAVKNRQSVFVPGSPVWGKPKPAAFMIHLSGVILYRLFNVGMYVYRKKK